MCKKSTQANKISQCAALLCQLQILITSLRLSLLDMRSGSSDLLNFVAHRLLSFPWRYHSSSPAWTKIVLALSL